MLELDRCTTSTPFARLSRRGGVLSLALIVPLMGVGVAEACVPGSGFSWFPGTHHFSPWGRTPVHVPADARVNGPVERQAPAPAPVERQAPAPAPVERQAPAPAPAPKIIFDVTRSGQGSAGQPGQVIGSDLATAHGSVATGLDDPCADGRHSGQLAFAAGDGSVIFLPATMLADPRQSGGQLIVDSNGVAAAFVTRCE